MAKTVHHEYLGWDITIRCIQRPQPNDEVNLVSKYSSSAHAALGDGEDAEAWIDPRVQLVSLGTRTFGDGEDCIETLLAEVKEVIDALRR